jgi:hypothetical protein
LTAVRTAVADPALSAIVTDRFPLHYAEGPGSDIDRPGWVRSGSGLAWVPTGLAMVQDDANFIAVHDPGTGLTRSIVLPAGEGGLRQFDDVRGNKRYKLDLEACVAVVEDGGGTILLCFGSGSTDQREHVVMVDRWEKEPPRVRLVSTPELFRILRRETAFAGSELNIEGAVQLGNALRLFSRGNGAPRDGRQPVNATCDLDLDALLGHLRNPMGGAPPAPTGVVQYRLGAIDGVALGFTDASVRGSTVLFTATAEISPDATQDGPVVGSAVGLISAAGTARWAPLTDARGELVAIKVEGLADVPDGEDGLYIVLDGDDPGAASELCRVALTGPWSPTPG